MQDLLKKMRAHADERLVLPPGQTPAQNLAPYATFLKVETHRLLQAHREGMGGKLICAGRAEMMDHLLCHLWDAAKSTLSVEAQKNFPPIALVAIGGYGRGELNPHSDVDFMFLERGQVVAGGKPLPHLARLIESILYPLWDLKLKVGHSVRSIEDCVREANGDMQSKTALIEARLLAGDEELFKKFQITLIAKCVVGYEAEYIAARIEDQTTRRAKFGNSACMQEPNLKNGCGGLRDFQNLLWMTFVKYRKRTLPELVEHELVGETERRQLEEAYDFLLRVRTELHYHANRPVDVLGKNLQPAVAYNLGHTERSPSKRIEKFMRDVYTHSRNIYLITRTLEQRLALLPNPEKKLSFTRFLPKRAPKLTEPVDGFRFSDTEVYAASNRIFRDQPRRLMRAFLHAQQRGLKLHPDLAQLVRNNLSLVDREFLYDEHVSETFLSILNQRGNVSRILRAMHEVDFLGQYVPEFGRLTCLVQHEFYHQYAADEHTLVCLDQLDRIWEGTSPLYKTYTPLLQSLDRPFLLYLALLLHDTGKPTGHGRHSDEGADLAMRVARRLRLDEPARETLHLVIKHHLLLSNTSQRRDLDDPAVIRQIARQLQLPETLTLLTLHTFADAQATSDKLWNGFKDSLLWQLYGKTMPILTGETHIVREEEKLRERLMEELWGLLKGRVDDDEVHAHFAQMSLRYFQIHTAEAIGDDLLLIHRFMEQEVSDGENPLAPVVHWRNDVDRGGNTVKICTWDRAGLFGKISGSLSAAGLNILSAQIFTRADGIALDTYFVTDARTGNLADNEQRDRFEKTLTRVLGGEDVDLSALIARQKIPATPYQAYAGDAIPTQIVFDNDASETRTLVEVETEDRVGLLYAIVQTLAELDLNISAARICTEKGAAIDSFYIHELDGGKILAPERQRQIERQLRHAIRELEKTA